MHTLIRDRDITTPDFVFYSDRLIRLVLLYFIAFISLLQLHASFIFLFMDLPFKVVEHGLGHLPFTEKQVITPTGILHVAPYIL